MRGEVLGSTVFSLQRAQFHFRPELHEKTKEVKIGSSLFSTWVLHRK